MIKKLLVFSQYLIPKHLLSRLVGWLANCRWSWLKNLMINWFIKHYKVDMSIAEKPQVEDYATFNEFFIRKLKAGVRPIAAEPDAIISPVDGVLSQWGEISQGKLIQAKGFEYSLDVLLARSKFTQNFREGQFMTLYLSSKDYHRVHMPMDGGLLEMTYVPGSLFAVNQATTCQIPAIFAKNERVLCTFQTTHGKMAVILVGAMLVASINTAWAGKVTPNKNKSMKSSSYEGIKLRKGEEMGYFCMGSTVIVLFEPQKARWETSLAPNQSVKYGQKIGISVGRP
jgi:phosphatidylserine decarboxylase